MGVVYKAYDPAIARTVAIKAIRLGEFSDEDERLRVQERLLREAQSAGLLSHPSIVTIYDILEEENSAYIFMEFVRGRSLDYLLRQGQLPPKKELLGYLRQVADALDSAHRRGVIHRDIKPGNIILAEPEGTAGKIAKVADFGVAKFISQDTTHSGTMMGTPAYMSPEQIQGLISDGRSDQFSLAVVIYELLTGSKPFVGEGLPTLFYQICKVDAKPAHESNGEVPPAVSDVLAKALAKQPSDRFASCLEFVGALNEAVLRGTVVARAAAASVRPVVVGPSGEPARPTVIPEIAGPDTPVEFPPLTRRRADEDERLPYSSRWIQIGLIAALFVCAVVAAMLVRRGPSTSASTPTANPAQTQTVTQPSRNQASSTGRTATQAPAQQQPSESQTQTTVPPYSAVPVPAPVSPQLTTPSPKTGGLIKEALITTQPAGAEVVVDGREDMRCIAPCSLRLPAGRHTLTASSGGYNNALKVFSVPEDPTVYVNLGKQEGVVVISTDPAGSRVTVDGKEYEKTPVTLRLSAGAHQLVLMNGEKRHEETITVQNDGWETRSFKW